MSVQKSPDQYVKVGNVNIRFWAGGDKGTAVILLHGMGGCVENWRLNIGALAQQHRVYAVDFVGFGRSDKVPAMITPSKYAQFISDLMQTLHIEKASLVGNSMGGLASLQFAIKFPDKLLKLVLVDSVGIGRETSLSLRLASLPIVGEFLMQPSRSGCARFAKAIIYDPALVTDAFVEFMYQMSSQPGAKRCFLTALRGMVNFRGVRADVARLIVDNLGNIKAPTLIIWGKQDRVLPVAQAQVAAKNIPNNKVQLFDHCGHVAQFEHPEEFNKLVLDFLAG